MDWRTKAAVQTVFSHIPFGEKLNYFCQRRVFKNLPVDGPTFDFMVDTAERHLKNLTIHGEVPVDEARFYEFGAGRDLVVPLAFYGMGVNHQILVDIRRMVRPELVADTVARMRAGRFDRVPGSPSDELSAILSAAGVVYRAPCDARSTGMADGAVDYITSTDTLEHVPADDIRRILHECHRILSRDGVMSFLIDYGDHYSYADPSISAYNYLQFEDQQWRRWSPPLQFQNRLRHSDYVRLFADEGFEIVAEEPAPGSDADLELLRGMSLASRFTAYEKDDLAIQSAFFTVRPCRTDAPTSPRDGTR